MALDLHGRLVCVEDDLSLDTNNVLQKGTDD